jgi:hypothetical protein
VGDIAIITIQAEARRIAERSGVTDVDGLQRIEAALRVRAYQDAIRPYIDAKVRVEALRLIKYVQIASDGTVHAEYEPLSLEAQELMAGVDKAIEAEARRFGFRS